MYYGLRGEPNLTVFDLLKPQEDFSNLKSAHSAAAFINQPTHCCPAYFSKICMRKMLRIFRTIVYLVDSVSITLDICSHFTVRTMSMNFPAAGKEPE